MGVRKEIQIVNVYVTDPRGSIMPRFFHCHPDYMEILYVYAGSGIYFLDNCQYPVKAGDMIIFNSGSIHGEDPTTANSLWTYTVACSGVQQPTLLPNHLAAPGISPVIHCGKDRELIEPMIRMICQMPETEHSQELAIHLTESLICYSMDHLPAGEKTGSGKGYDLVSQAKEYIDHHFKEEIIFGALAGRMHVNASYLSRVFSRIMHFTMKQYQMQLRLGAVQTMLIDTDEEIQEVGAACGYLDSCYFHALFKKNTGMTPAEYRDTFRQMRNMRNMRK